MLFLGGGAVGLAVLALWLYCIFDVIATDDGLLRNLPKTLWLVIVIFLPTIGSIAWLIMGRPLYAGWRPGDTTRRPAPRARGPEDDPGWTRSPHEDRLREWERDLDRRERELRHRKDADTPPPNAADDHDTDDPPFPYTW